MISVVLHKYNDKLTAVEFGVAETQPENFLVFIGGLGDGFMTVPYIPALSEGISTRMDGKWVVIQALISSSYLGFGIGSLKRDTQELSELVKYLRVKRGTKNSKVVLMGHSTGSQDVMEYLSKSRLSKNFDVACDIDAGIIQAPVSDSEGLTEAFRTDSTLADLKKQARRLVEEGRKGELMPTTAMKYTFGSPSTAYRFDSLLNERGDDDYFSSYLESSDFDKTFRMVQKPLLILYSGNDEFVPERIDKQGLIDRWQSACEPRFWSRYSKVIQGASHNVGENSSKGAVEEMIETVISFLCDTF